MQHNRFRHGPAQAIEPGQSPSLILAILLLIGIWAIVYLPALGSLELKGEEGRRIFPALEMLRTGDWIVPHIAGEPYLRKPPLINWAIAAAVKCTGLTNEWTVRLPSVLGVLALGIGMLLFCRTWLGVRRATAAALMTITMLGMIGKGRLAEIDALFTAFSGIGCVAWLAWRETGRSKWLYWLVPFIPIGVAALAKGPIHLLFFYAMVLGVLWANRAWRELWHPAHILGLIVAGAIFAAWYLPYSKATASLGVEDVWKGQTVGRLTAEIDVTGWLLNIPRAASDLLPWVLLMPLLWKPVTVWDQKSYSGVRNGVLVSVFGMLLLPAVLPRYIMPAFPILGILIAIALFEWRWITRPFRLVVCASVAMGAVMCIYALAVVPFAHKRQVLRPAAAAVNAKAPANVPLFVLDPDFQPVLFYIRNPLVYLRDDKEIPEHSPAVLVKDREVEKLSKKFRDVTVLYELPGEGKRALTLLSVGERKP